MRRVRKIAAIAGTIVLGLLVIIALVLGLAWPRSALTGVGLRFFLQQRDLHLAHATIHITRSTADFSDVDVKDGSGNDFFLAKNIHIIYDTRGLIGRGDRRFGLHSVLIDHPVLRLIHRADGSWNAGSLASASPAPAATPNPVPSPSAAPLVAPYRLTLHIAAGEVQVIDPQAPVRFARAFSVNDINGLLAIDEGALSHGTLRAHLRTAQGNTALQATFFENDATQFARAQVLAPDVPIAPIVDGIVPSTSFAFERGRVDLHGEAYAVGYAAGSPSWRLSADGMLRGGQLRVIPLAVPLRDLRGPVHFQDGQLSTTLFQGTAAGTPVSVQGGMQLLGGVRFALSAKQTGRLESQRRLLAFSSTLPLQGPGALQLRLDGPVDDLRLSGALAVREGAFGPIHLHAAAGTFFYNHNHLTLSATDAASAGGGVHADGDVDLSGATPRFTLALVGAVPAAQVPVVGNVTRSGTAEALGTLHGTSAQFISRGYVQVRGAPLRARAFFDAGPQRLTLGPLLVQSGGGELMLLSRVDRSSGKNLQRSIEAIAHQAHLRIAAGAYALPDAPSLSVSLPAVDGTFDGVAYADSVAAAPALAIDLRARSFALAGVDLHDVTLRAGGQRGLVQISNFSARGGAARAQGSGSVLFDERLRPQAAALHGTMDADLSAFSASAPSLHMSGLVQGQYDAMLDAGEWTLAAQTRSSDAQIAGVSVHAATATVRGQTGGISSVLAQLDVGGGTLSAVGALSQLANATPSNVSALANNIDLSVLKGFGLPLQGGSASGIANIAGTLAHPRIDAAGAVATQYRGIPIASSMEVGLADGVLHSSASRVAVDHNTATVTGSVSGIGTGFPLTSAALNVQLDVHHADLSSLNRFVSSTAALTGNTNAQMHITGTAGAPRISGYVDTDSGTFRGVTFEELHGDVRGQGRSWHLGNGAVQLGSSHFQLAGDLAPGSVGVDAMSEHVDMSDFNDFFGGSDVFAGTGNFRLGLRSSNAGLSANGGLRLEDAAVRNYQLGHIETQFSSDRGALLARLAQSGPGGSATLSGRVAFRAFARGLPEFSTAIYDVKADVHNLDVDEITPLIGREDLGLTGSLDAVGTLQGSLHRPIANGRINLHDGHLGRIAINSFSATLQSDTRTAAVRDLRFATRFLTGSGQGRYDFQNGQLQGALSLEAADLAELSSVVHVPVAMTGPAHAQLGLAGTLAHPRFDAMLAGTNDTVAKLAFSSVNARFAYVPGEFTIGDTQLGLASGGTIDVKGVLPIQLQPLALGPRQRPVGLTLTATKASLAELNTITGSAAKLDGEVNARATLTGTAGNPSVAGNASIRNASLNSSWETVPLTNASADLSLSQDTIRLQNLHGKLGGGSVAIDGAAHIVPAVGLRTNAGLQFYTRVGLRNADVNVPGWLRGTFNGDLSLTKEAVRPYLAGSVGLSNATVPFSAILSLATGSTSALASAATPQNVPGVPKPKPGHTVVYGGNIFGKSGGMLTNNPQASPTPVPFTLPPVDFNVAVTAGKDVRVRGGSAIDLTADGAVLLGGSLSNPTLAGSFRAIRGQVGYFDTTFRLQRGSVTFNPNEGLLPTLDASAITNVSGSEITLTLSGRVDNLSIELLSNPPMTREEILATLLHAPQFNALTSGSQTALVQTAQNYFNAELARSLLFPFESALAQSLNLEQVALIFDPTGNLALEVRTHFSNNVSALYRSSLTVPITQAYGVSYRLRDYLALELLQAQAPPPTGITSTQVTLRYLFR